MKSADKKNIRAEEFSFYFYANNSGYFHQKASLTKDFATQHGAKLGN